MADAKHTAGPWKIHKRSWPMTIMGNVHQITNDDRLPAAFVPAWDAPGEGEEDGTEEAIANARLVAAAPDMLSALQMVSGTDLHHEILAAVDAAIAKATA